MCVMEVDEESRVSNMLQAMAHNASTSDRDCDQLRHVLKGRGRHDLLVVVDQAQEAQHQVYAIWLEAFGEEIARDTGDTHRHSHGSERARPHILQEAMLVRDTAEAGPTASR